jgi:predicted thioesterase
MGTIGNIQKGMTREEVFLVEEQHTAYHIGSGDSKVLATPWMISFMERVSNRLLAECLPDEYITVGTRVDVRHLAATPVNVNVMVHAEVLEVLDRRITLRIEAWDNEEKLGEGLHERVIVNRERFLQKALEKNAVH